MKELTYNDWLKNPIPRNMWVWDDDEKDKKQRKVIYFLDPKLSYPIVALDDDAIGTENFKHCAEIEEPKTRLMTKQELSWWLREKPTREMKYTDHESVYFEYSYYESEENVPVDKDILIREDGGEWREPLIEVTDD